MYYKIALMAYFLLMSYFFTNEEVMKKILLLLLAVLFALGCAQKIKQTNDQRIYTHPEWSKNSTIYEVNIRQFSEEGTFAAFQKELPRLKEMGIEIIWLMPIHPIGEKNRKGTLGSYYAVKDYKDVNPEFGTKEDFRNLVQATHEQGMKIILDWVANHTSWDNVWTKTNPEFFTKDSLGNFVPPVKDWSDVIDLNYKNKALWPKMIDALDYWVKEFDIDGYRCDVAGMVPIEFWTEARLSLDSIKPVFMLAEDGSPEMHKAFDMSYSWDLHHLMNKIAGDEKNAKDLTKYFLKEAKKFEENDYRMIFTSNHDENSWNGTVFERMGNGAELFAVFSSVVPGMPLVYNGQEAGMDKRLEFFEKDPIEWKDHKFYDVYKKLFELKQENEALWNGKFGGKMVELSTSNQKDLYAFKREKGEDAVIAVFNMSSEPSDAEIQVDKLNGEFIELFSNKKFEIESSFNLKLEPWDYKILVK